MTDWFQALTGFAERPYSETQAQFELDGRSLRSRHNGRVWSVGVLETPTLLDLRTRARDVASGLAGRLRQSTVVGDVRRLHREPANRHALFQVASQFNLLEMTAPEVTPEHGVTRYGMDPTQGPACAIAAGAATIYRNYFASVGDQVGQTSRRQIDCLADIGEALGNHDNRLWTMRNGYAMCSRPGLATIDRRIEALDDAGRDALRDRLRVGLHTGVEVTDGASSGHLVSQVFCSALPVSYTGIASRHWARFASLILEGAYEATLWAAVLNAHQYGSNVVFLTFLGGGAFGNDRVWIEAAMRRAVETVGNVDLDVRLVRRG